MAIGSAFATVIEIPELDLEAVDRVESKLPVKKVFLPRGMGIVADPAREPLLTIPNYVKVVQVPPLLSETGVGLGVLDLHEAGRMAREAKFVRSRIVRYILGFRESLLRKGWFTRVVRVASAAVL